MPQEQADNKGYLKEMLNSKKGGGSNTLLQNNLLFSHTINIAILPWYRQDPVEKPVSFRQGQEMKNRACPN